MRGRPTFNFRDLLLAAGGAGGCALALGLILAGLSKPSHFESRISGLEGSASQTRNLLRSQPSQRVYPPDAICRGEPGAAATALRDRITEAAAQANLSLDFLEAHPEAPPDAPMSLAPIRLKFTVTGSYEGVVALLSSLARQRPDVFADGVDMTAKTANLTASFSGRAFCAA